MTPPRLAALLALAYVGVSGTYIVVSGRLAEALVSSAAELAALERFKGVAFVLVTGVLLFFGAWWALRRVRADELEMARARELLLASERQAMAGLYVSTLAHDANNVATVVLGALAEVEGSAAVDAELKAIAGDGRDAMLRLTQLFRDLKGLGRPETGRVNLDVAQEVRQVAALLRGAAALRGRGLTVAGPATLTWSVHAGRLHQLLVNLLVNAAEAVGDQGRIEVELSVDGDALVIAVHDDGPGLTEAQQARLFTPFFTTKPAGTGLGLLSVRECARAHGGEVSAGRSSSLGGACFRVRLPGAADATSPPGAPNA